MKLQQIIKLKNELLSLLFVLFVFGVQAQSINKYKGKVIDVTTNIPIEGASVSDDSKTVLTSASGEFSIESKDSILMIMAMGYKTRHIMVMSKEQLPLTIALENEGEVLKTVVVTGFENNRNILQTAGAVSVLTPKEINANNNSSILPALNRVPGVKMEEQAMGNFKINLRGSALRDAFGVRNLKLYWEDIPLTSPDNSASHAISFVPSQIGSIEIIKGPAGSIYGAGMGGVVIFRNDRPKVSENSLQTEATFGSYGLFVSSTTYKMNNDKLLLSANYTHEQTNGYRQNEAGQKDAVNIFGKFYLSKKRMISLILKHDEGHYGIAGSVDSLWAFTTPRKGVQFSIDNRTGVRKTTYTLAGVSQEYKFNDWFSNTTSVFADFQTLNHPYGQNVFYNIFLKQSVGGYGARTKFSFTPTFGNVKAQFLVGDELLFENQFVNNYTIKNANVDALLSSNQIDILSNNVFAQASFDFPKAFFLTVAASVNTMQYNILDLIPQSATHESATGKEVFRPNVSPRVALVKTFANNMAVHGSVSFGFSPATITESKNPDGSFNQSIQAEKGINYEIGFRGSVLQHRFVYDLTLYQLDLRDAILPYYNEFGGTSYRNAGKTNQRGIELALSYEFSQEKNQQRRWMLKPWANFTFNDYRFKEFTQTIKNGNDLLVLDLAGNHVTGVSPFSVNAGIDFEIHAGFYANVVLNYLSKTPINDRNTYYEDAYTLLAAKIGYRLTVVKRFTMDFFIGANNLLNTKYSSWISFNADANSNPPQFYNSSPGLNFYGGIRLKYDFGHSHK